MPAKKKRTVVAPPAPEPRPWDKLLAAQKAFEAAEREYGHNHDWLSERQAYTTLDRIDETMEELLGDMRRAPGLHIVPPLPDLTPTVNLLFIELRGRLKQRLGLELADRALRARDGGR